MVPDFSSTETRGNLGRGAEITGAAGRNSRRNRTSDWSHWNNPRYPIAPMPRGMARVAHNGILSCFFQGFSSSLPRNIANARVTRLRVEWGMMTSSI